MSIILHILTYSIFRKLYAALYLAINRVKNNAARRGMCLDSRHGTVHCNLENYVCRNVCVYVFVHSIENCTEEYTLLCAVSCLVECMVSLHNNDYCKFLGAEQE